MENSKSKENEKIVDGVSKAVETVIVEKAQQPGLSISPILPAVLKTFGYKQLFRFEGGHLFVKAEMPFTPSEGHYINYNGSHYKVVKVLHDIAAKETRITCKRTH